MNLKNKKICLACSSGGHLAHLWTVKDAWKENERFWVTFEKADAKSILKDEKNTGVTILQIGILKTCF